MYMTKNRNFKTVRPLRRVSVMLCVTAPDAATVTAQEKRITGTVAGSFYHPRKNLHTRQRRNDRLYPNIDRYKMLTVWIHSEHGTKPSVAEAVCGRDACFRKAANSVSGRIYPCYLPANLYVETAEREKARETARILLTKEPKIHSSQPSGRYGIK